MIYQKQIVTKLIDAHTYYVVYDSKEVDCEPYTDNNYNTRTTRWISIPNWDKMKGFPQEVIKHFKNQVSKDGTVSTYLSYYESAEKRLNDYLSEIHLTKEDLISITYIPSNEQNTEYFVVVYQK